MPLLLFLLPVLPSVTRGSCCHYQGINFTIDQTKKPYLDLNTWWGSEEMREYQDRSIQPFRIEFSDQKMPLLLFLLPVLPSVTRGSCCHYQGINFTIDQTKKPYLDLNTWWGPEEMREYQDRSIQPFRIEFSDQMISDLRHRIYNHRHFLSLHNSSFTYGFNSNQMMPWLRYWAEEYDFRAREKILNQFPMFRTNVQGLDIHFLWIKPDVPAHVEVVPILMLHSWPGSVREFYDFIPRITAWEEGRDFAVEVIAPSLPGLGFSQSATRPGFGAAERAVVMRNLMRRLGFNKFYVQGNDIGHLVGSDLVTLFPEEVLGFHTTFPVILTLSAVLLQIVGSIQPTLVVEPGLVHKMYPLSRVAHTLMLELGYMHEQATKPDTLGYGLSDSPVGLLAWIMEKFSSGTLGSNRNLPDGGLTNFNKDDMIDNVMMYWVPNAMPTAVRFYAETMNIRSFALGVVSYPTPVPTWAIQPSSDMLYQSPLIISIKYPNLLNATALKVGGHFLIFEMPELVMIDIMMALESFRIWHKRNEYSTPSLNDDSVTDTYQNLTRISHKLGDITKRRGNGYPQIFWAAQCFLDSYSLE